MLIARRFPEVTPGFIERFHAEPSVFLGRARHASYVVHQRHLSIRAVFRGHFHYYLDGREHLISEGQALVINADTPYGSCFDGPGETEVVSVFFGPDPDRQLGISPARFIENALPLAGNLGDWLKGLGTRLDAGYHHEITRDDLAAGLNLMNGTRRLREPPGPVALARALLNSRFREPWNLDDLAAEVGLSKYHLVRRFADEIGMPPMRYLARRRAVYAQRLMNLRIPACHAAIEAGFGSRATLYRALRAFAE